MEWYSMFLGRMNQYCENDYITKCKLQIHCDSYQLPMEFFTELEQKISQFIWKHKRPQITSLEKEEWSWRNQPSWLQIILQSYSHQESMVWYWPKNRIIDQWKKIESPEINPSTYGYLIFDNGAKTTSSINGA